MAFLEEGFNTTNIKHKFLLLLFVLVLNEWESTAIDD